MNSTSQKDSDLMKKISKGDPESIKILYDRFGRLVYKLAHQYTHTNHQTQDAVQEIFIKLWKSSSNYDSKKAKLITWVLLISRRHLIDQLRKKEIKTSSSDESLNDAVPINMPSSAFNAERNILAKEFLKLPQPQREILERAYVRGFTLEKISKQLKLPLGTVKSSLSRGLQKIRENVGKK